MLQRYTFIRNETTLFSSPSSCFFIYLYHIRIAIWGGFSLANMNGARNKKKIKANSIVLMLAYGALIRTLQCGCLLLRPNVRERNINRYQCEILRPRVIRIHTNSLLSRLIRCGDQLNRHRARAGEREREEKCANINMHWEQPNRRIETNMKRNKHWKTKLGFVKWE